MSGVGCVQDRLPPNAHYGYTSAAICNEPFVDVRAPGPNAYGADPNASYLGGVHHFGRRPTAGGRRVPAALGTGPSMTCRFVGGGRPRLARPQGLGLRGLAATAP